MKLFISIRPDRRGGGSNSFAHNLVRWCRKQGIPLVRTLGEADAAVIIAHVGVSPEELRDARERGCHILHRIDEHFGGFEQQAYLDKHARIAALNQYAHVTVFQSRFVENTAGPVLQPARYAVLLNGGDPALFRPGRRPGADIGHVTWGTIPKKRLDQVHEAILAHPEEQFRLVGNQGRVADTFPSFRGPNVRLRGARNRRGLIREYHRMKLLYYPSENDPCPNTVIESILCGVPVCYHDSGGTPELVRDCGEPLDRLSEMLERLPEYRARCLVRRDLAFADVAERYRRLWEHPEEAKEGVWEA